MKNIEMRFGPEITVWNNLLKQGGGRIRCEPGKAISTLLRLNRARKLLRERDGDTSYDLFALSHAKGSDVIIVQPRKMLDVQIEPLSLEVER